MPNKITKDNYRKWILRLDKEIERAKRSGSHTSHQWFLTEQIGNMHWEFGNFEEARACYDRAVSFALKEFDRPLVSTAWLYWKAARFSEAERECRAVMAHLEKELPNLEAPAPRNTESEEGRRLLRAYLHAAEASLMLGDYAAAKQWSVKATALTSGTPGTSEALRQLAASLDARDREAYEKALRLLRGIREWPTFESNPNAELYRLALYLGRDHFGSVPEDLAKEELDPGKWEKFRS